VGIPRQHIRVRRAVAADWIASNPILLDGELGLEQDTNRLKAGDGSTPWSGLGYVSGNFLGFDGTLESLADVAASARVDGSLLVYDGTTGQWIGGPNVTVLEIVNGGNF
jgi:hypothetical protein